MLRRIALLLLALCMLISLTGCKVADPSDKLSKVLIDDSIEENTDENGNPEYDPSVKEHPYYKYRKNYNVGSCKNLSGNIPVYCYFVNDGESSWNAFEAYVMMSNTVNPVFDFLEEQAARYGVELSFDVQMARTDEKKFTTDFDGIINPDLYEGGSTKIVMKRIAQELGYLNDEEMNYELRRETSGDIIFLALVNKPGISYSRHIMNTDVDFCEHAVIFSENILSMFNGYECASMTRQILYMFGGEDYYKTENKYKLGLEYFPTDLMISDHWSLNRISIEGMTAFAIGWEEEPHEVCYRQQWWEASGI